MLKNISQEKIESGLDFMISKLLAEPTEKHFDLFDKAIEVVGDLGYEVLDYKEISKTLRSEYL